MTHSEWSYSVGLVIPAELVSVDPAEIEALVRRDLQGQRDVNMYRTADPAALNSLNVMVVRRSGDPATLWETVMSESQAKTRDGDADYCDITQTWSENPNMEVNREIAREQVRIWLDQWENSEFSHDGKAFDITPDQERRLAISQGEARRVGDGFTSAWYAKDGSKVTFPNRGTWESFYQSFHAHLETGNSAFEEAMSNIASAANTAALDAALNGLPSIPGTATARATGPLPGGQADPAALKPKMELVR